MGWVSYGFEGDVNGRGGEVVGGLDGVGGEFSEVGGDGFGVDGVAEGGHGGVGDAFADDAFELRVGGGAVPSGVGEIGAGRAFGGGSVTDGAVGGVLGLGGVLLGLEEGGEEKEWEHLEIVSWRELLKDAGSPVAQRRGNFIRLSWRI